MAASPITADNFLGIALVINRSQDGPAFVFHHPPHIRPPSGDLDAPDPADLNDVLLERLSQPAHRETRGLAGLPRDWDRDDHYTTDSGTQIVPWEHCVGFPARDLAGILTPARSYHKKLFQLSLDPLHCISYPIHVPASGRWKKQKKAHKSSKISKPSDEHLLSPQDAETPASAGGGHGGNSNSNGSSNGKEKDTTGVKKDDDDEKRSSMTMFSLVFFLKPGNDEVKDLVDALYINIVKKANKAFKFSQQHSDFVWKESKRILAAKDKAREEKKNMSFLWKEILQMSSLAAAMHDIYEAVSQNKIAALHLDTAAGVLTPSFQIPSPFYVSDLPHEDDPRQRGLWLTTANAFMSLEDFEEPGFLDRNFALLLMDDEKKIIAELQADPDPTTVSMVEFVRLSKPTMSFYQVGQSNVLTLGQVRKYAQHFIFWRRAIAIPPLHARDVYIVSPNCDPSRLPRDTLDWQRQFPASPSLPGFLGELSHAPRPYKNLAPSKIHRPTYLAMLAWLMRRGWVTQLCTFAYVVVWPEILYEVHYEIEAEEIATAEKAREEASVATPTDPPKSPEKEDASHENLEASVASLSVASAAADPPSPTSAASQVTITVEHAAEKARLERIADKAHREATEKVIAHARKPPPQATAHPSINSAAHLHGLVPHVILDPKKATGNESRYLSAIAQRLRDDKVKSAWGLFCRYFDGRTALERIALQEDMKRKEVWNLLTAMTEYIMCTRHW